VSGGIGVTWVGHSCVLIELDGVRVLTDPLLRPHAGLLRRVGSPPGVHGGVDAALVSHLHHDHCDLPSLRTLGAGVVAMPAGAGRWAARCGLPDAVELAPGETHPLGDGVRVTAVPAEHLGRREPWGPTAMSVGHLVEGPSGTVWAAGDTGLYEGMRGLAGLTASGRIDLALVPVWGWGPNLGPGHLDPEQAAEAVDRAGATHAVPVHWGTLHPWGLRRAMRGALAEPGPAFARAVQQRSSGTRVHVLPLGGRMRLAVPDAGSLG
jgi:L-ascorbate metabolism protein UlaG (beta-lactamase superfamily)